tara:strand:- start:3598 stop:3993 length:396 start_codon:yes stop_codon:yes gene_type:complete
MYHAHYLTQKGIKEYKATISTNHLLDLKRNKPTPEKCENLIRLVFNYFEVPTEMMKSKSRKREIIVARQFASFFLKQEFQRLSLQKIADYFGQHHSSIVHSIKQINNLVEYDFESKEHHKNIMQKVIEMYK